MEVGDNSLSLLEELDPQSAPRRAKYEGFAVMKPLDSGKGEKSQRSMINPSS